ncbi:MAG: hypothetical protein JXR61_09265 [Prolixibacteraceae bacterium]|nr:hypothetical protein [Prolixibacteraceae bacterium]
MLFKRKNNEEYYFNYSIDKKVDFYFDFFFSKIDIHSIVNYEEIIKNEIVKEFKYYRFFNGRAIYEGSRNIKQLTSSLGHLTGAWHIDWAWIMHHILLDFINIGIFQNLPDYNESKKVYLYKYVPDKYYSSAKKVYLKDLCTQEPRLFEPNEILKNGIGLKDNSVRFKPFIGATLWNGFDNEYWDMTELKVISDDYVWDSNKKMFDLKPYERKFERKSKVIITIGDKKYKL